MSVGGLPSFALGCFLLVLAIEPHVAHGSSRSSTLGVGGGGIAAPPATEGICASSVAIHGYKCQEFDVIKRSSRNP
ncbi:hypothetical protein BT93_J1672 [Corymbia citriodora subsp. variegata]|nr:hypothetical protein BT93_J1672 [Corymbia citriodora subsp. variegata]